MTKILRVFPYPLNDLTVTDGTHTITLASGLHLVQQYMVGATPKSVYQFDLEYLENNGYISSGVLTITSTDYAGNTKQVNTSTGSSPYDAMWEDIATYTGNSGGSGNSGDSGGDDPGSGSRNDPEPEDPTDPEEPEVNDPEGIYIDCLDEISLMADTKTAIKTAIESKGVTVAEGTPFANYAGLIDNIVELKGETQTIIPTTTQQIITPTLGKNGITEVTVSAVTSTIDPNIIPANIKVGTTILGVEGTNQGGTLQAKTLTVGAGTPTEVVLTPDTGNYGLSSVTVDMDYIEDELDDILGDSVVTDNTTLVFTDISNGVMSSWASTFKFPDSVTELSGAISNTAILSGIVKGITSFDFNNITTLSGNLQFLLYQAPSTLTNIAFTHLTTITSTGSLQSAFSGCTGITSISFPSLTTISGAMNSIFTGCTNLASLTFPELTTLNSTSMGLISFISNTAITSITFPKLANISNSGIGPLYQAFYGSSIQELSFPAITSSIPITMNQTPFNNMLYQVTGCTVHLPSNLQSVIGSCTDVTNGFGGTDTVVLFDLPATE